METSIGRPYSCVTQTQVGPVIFVWFIIQSTFTPRFWRTTASGIVTPPGNPRQPTLTKILPSKPTLRNPTRRPWSYWVGCDHAGAMALDLRHILPNVVITWCQCNRSYCTHGRHPAGLPCSCWCSGANICLTIQTSCICRSPCNVCTRWGICWYNTCWMCAVWQIHPRWLHRPWLCMKCTSHWSVSWLSLWCYPHWSRSCHPRTNPGHSHTNKRFSDCLRLQQTTPTHFWHAVAESGRYWGLCVVNIAHKHFWGSSARCCAS